MKLEKGFQLVLLTAVLFAIPLAAKSLKVEGFTHLGNLTTRHPENDKQFVQSDYYVSAFSSSWRGADDSCNNMFGKGSHVVFLETMEEELGVDELLVQFGSGGDFKLKFWTGGAYFTINDGWSWASRHEGAPQADITEFNWGPAGAPVTPNIYQRIVIQHIQGLESYWVGSDDTVLIRYICEKPLV